MDAQQYLAARRAAASEEARESLFQEAIKRENEDRAWFARAREGWEVLGREDLSSHPHPSLVPVYDGLSGQLFQGDAFNVDPPGKLDCDANGRVFALDPAERASAAGSHAVVPSLDEFKSNFYDVFCEGLLRYLNWDNVFAAGGCVLACATPIPPEHSKSMVAKRKYFHDVQYSSSDVDLFLYGLDEEQARAKLVEIYNAIVDACPFQVVCFRSAHAVTLVSQYPYRHIQIVLRLYSSPYEVLAGFDVDSCTMGFDGKMVYADIRAHHALVTRRNTIDLTRRSPSYEMRLAKYGARGFEVEVQNLQRNRVDPGIFERPWHTLEGLAKLLVLERLRTPEARHAHFERQKLARGGRTRLYGFKHGLDSNNEQRAEEHLGGAAEVSNYSTVFLPWGQNITAHQTMRLMAKKDEKLNNRWFARNRPYRLHPCFFGTAEEILEDCSPSDPPFPEKPEDDVEEDPIMKEHRETYVRGPLTFITDNPGRQRIGSFHPLDEAGWSEGVYFVETTDELFTAANANNVDKLKEVLGRVPNGLSQRDFFGRTLLQLAIMAKARDAVEYLLLAGANPLDPLAGRRSVFHLAALYDQAWAVPLLQAAALKTLQANTEDEKVIKKTILDWVRALDDDNRISAVQIALYLGHFSVVDELCKIGAYLTTEEFRESRNYDPLRLIPTDEERFAKGVECLVRNGFRCEVSYYRQHRISTYGLNYFIDSKNSKLLRILLERDPACTKHINGLDPSWEFPLLRACYRLDYDCVKTLMDFGARLMPSEQDLKPFTDALPASSPQVANLLRISKHPSYCVEKFFLAWLAYFNNSSFSRSLPLNQDQVAAFTIQAREAVRAVDLGWINIRETPPVTPASFEDMVRILRDSLKILSLLLSNHDMRLTDTLPFSPYVRDPAPSNAGEDIILRLKQLRAWLTKARADYRSVKELDFRSAVFNKAMDELISTVSGSSYLKAKATTWKYLATTSHGNVRMRSMNKDPQVDQLVETRISTLMELLKDAFNLVKGKIEAEGGQLKAEDSTFRQTLKPGKMQRCQPTYPSLQEVFESPSVTDPFPLQKSFYQTLSKKREQPSVITLMRTNDRVSAFSDDSNEPWLIPAVERYVFLQVTRSFRLVSNETFNKGPLVSEVRSHMAYCELFDLAYKGEAEKLWPLIEEHDLPIAVADVDSHTLLLMAVLRDDVALFNEVVRIVEVQYFPPEEQKGRKVIAEKPPRRIDNTKLMEEDYGSDYDEEDEEDVDDEDEGSVESDASKQEASPKEERVRPKGAANIKPSSLFVHRGGATISDTPEFEHVAHAIKEASKRFPDLLIEQPFPQVVCDVLRLAIILNKKNMVNLVLDHIERTCTYEERRRIFHEEFTSDALLSATPFAVAVMLDRLEILVILLERCLDLLDCVFMTRPLLSKLLASRGTFAIFPSEIFKEESEESETKKQKEKKSVAAGYLGIMTKVYGHKKWVLEEEERSGSVASVKFLPAPEAPTLLHIAALSGSVACYKFLADPSLDSPWMAILKKALQTKRFARFRALLAEARAKTPLAYQGVIGENSVQGDARLIARYLIGGDDTLRDARNWTPLHYAVASRTLEKLLNGGVVFSKALLETSYTSIPLETKVVFWPHFKDSGSDFHEKMIGESPLSLASRFGFSREVELLVDRLGLDPNFMDAYAGKCTPFLTAVLAKQFDTAKVLARLSRPETLLIPDHLGQTALMVCTSMDEIERLIEVVEQCPRVGTATLVDSMHARDVEGHIALHKAVAVSSDRPVRILMSWSAEDETKRSWMVEDYVTGRTPVDLSLDLAMTTPGSRAEHNATQKLSEGRFAALDFLTSKVSGQIRILAKFQHVRPARERRLPSPKVVGAVDELTKAQRDMQAAFGAPEERYLYQWKYYFDKDGRGTPSLGAILCDGRQSNLRAGLLIDNNEIERLKMLA